jgi:hypothetical protein
VAIVLLDREGYNLFDMAPIRFGGSGQNS